MTQKRRDYQTACSALAVHPDAFDCLLFRARKGPRKIITKAGKGVSRLSDKSSVAYADPIMARALRIRTDDVAGAKGSMDQPVVIVLSVSNVPGQSIILYQEYDGKKMRSVNLYVVKSIPGRAESRHYCIPFRGFDEIEGNKHHIKRK